MGVTQPVFVVDAFADAPFKGNPAAVVPLSEHRSDEWMQSVAREMNLSETAFVDMSTQHGVKPLRWFTPVAEVDLCGHATLATAHVLGGLQRFSTRSGELQCSATGDGWIEMDFPADPPNRVGPMDWNATLPGIPVMSAWRGVSDFLVEVGGSHEVRRLEPALDAIARLESRGLIVTARSDVDGADFVSRCFYPSMGIPEDPVTGSAHCTLASFWSPRLGRTRLVGDQLSRRTGRVRVRVDGDRVHLAGQAVTVLRGDFVDL